VNGFQIVSLSGSLTTCVRRSSKPFLLWMAFKLYLYQGLWQRFQRCLWTSTCCEWLSNCIFIRVFDNRPALYEIHVWVVNGFQIVSLSGSLTTSQKNTSITKMLWMAFKLYLYQGLWQPKIEPRNGRGCCEWLSNCIFIRVFDNKKAVEEYTAVVVNGFQIVSLSGSLTTPCVF